MHAFIRTLPAVALSLALLGCSSATPAPSNWTRWVCDNHTEVLWRFAGGDTEQVDLRLGGDDIAFRLTREPSGSGMLYSDGRLSFHSQGEEGLVYRTANDDLIGRGCKAP